MSDRHFAVIRLDTLLFTLGGFAEPELTARELRAARFKRLWLAGVPAREIASEFGCSRPNTSYYARTLQLPPRLRVVSAETREAQNAIIADLWMAGFFAPEIGRKLGLDRHTVWRRAHTMKLPGHGRDWRWRRRRAA